MESARASPSDQLSICFAHVAYRLHERFSALDTGIGSSAARDLATFEKRIRQADALASAGGVNARAVAEHAMALTPTLDRRIAAIWPRSAEHHTWASSSGTEIRAVTVP
jgi:phosphoglycerate dehydrogenase-like enzyme